MKGDFVMEEMVAAGADGVDFVDIFSGKLFLSFTRDAWMTESIIPKTGRRYWKLAPGGEKVYI